MDKCPFSEEFYKYWEKLDRSIPFNHDSLKRQFIIIQNDFAIKKDELSKDIDAILIEDKGKMKIYICNRRDNNTIQIGFDILNEKEDDTGQIEYFWIWHWKEILVYCSLIEGCEFINPLKCIKSKNSSLVRPMIEFEIKCRHYQSSLYPDIIMIRADKFNEFAELLKEKSFAVDKNDIDRSWLHIWMFLMKQSNIQRKIQLINDGFFCIPDPIYKNGEIILTKKNSIPVSRNDVKKVCEIINIFHKDFHKHDSNKFTTLLLWTVILPTSYCRKSNKGYTDRGYSIPMIYRHGPTGSAKSAFHDNFTKPFHDNTIPTTGWGGISTEARLREITSQSGFSVEIKEIKAIFEPKNVLILEQFKTNLESITCGQKFLDPNTFVLFPALINYYITMNFKKSIDTAIDRRCLYMGSTLADIKAMESNHEKYELFVTYAKPLLKFGGYFAGYWMIHNKDDAICLPWRESAIKLLKAMYEYAEMDFPKWISDEFYDEEQEEDSKQDLYSILRLAFIERIRNRYFKDHNKSVVTTEEGKYGPLTIKVDELPTTSEMYRSLLEEKCLPESLNKDIVIIPPWILTEFDISGVTKLSEFGNILFGEMAKMKSSRVKGISKWILQVPWDSIQKVLDKDEFEDEEIEKEVPLKNGFGWKQSSLKILKQIYDFKTEEEFSIDDLYSNLTSQGIEDRTFIENQLIMFSQFNFKLVEKINNKEKKDIWKIWKLDNIKRILEENHVSI